MPVEGFVQQRDEIVATGVVGPNRRERRGDRGVTALSQDDEIVGEQIIHKFITLDPILKVKVPKRCEHPTVRRIAAKRVVGKHAAGNGCVEIIGSLDGPNRKVHVLIERAGTEERRVEPQAAVLREQGQP